MTKASRPFSRKVAIVGVLVVVLLVVGGYVFLRKGSAKSQFRLVSANVGTVRQSVSTSGTIEPAQQQVLSFSSTGRVANVNVLLGQEVPTGTVLASLDTTGLSAQVAAAQASLDGAEAKLQTDEAASTGASAMPSGSLSQAQGAVAADQAQLEHDQATLRSACSASSPIADCNAAEVVFSGDELKLSSDQSSYLSALDQQMVATQKQGGGASVSAATLTSDQAQVNAAQDALNAAGVALQQANLVAPFAGTITSIGVVAGQQVSANGSATASITISGNGSWVVQSSLTDTQIGSVKIGDQVVVTPDGSTAPIYGVLSQVTTFSDSSSGVPSFPITISVTGNPAGLYGGAGAQVSIVTLVKSNVLVLPASAVHTVGQDSFVFTYQGGKEVRQAVSTGATGALTVQIVSGLSPGTEVVLARVTGSVPVLSGAGGRRGLFGGGGIGGGGGGLGKSLAGGGKKGSAG